MASETTFNLLVSPPRSPADDALALRADLLPAALLCCRAVPPVLRVSHRRHSVRAADCVSAPVAAAGLGGWSGMFTRSSDGHFWRGPLLTPPARGSRGCHVAAMEPGNCIMCGIHHPKDLSFHPTQPIVELIKQQCSRGPLVYHTIMGWDRQFPLENMLEVSLWSITSSTDHISMYCLAVVSLDFVWSSPLIKRGDLCP